MTFRNRSLIINDGPFHLHILSIALCLGLRLAHAWIRFASVTDRKLLWTYSTVNRIRKLVNGQNKLVNITKKTRKNSLLLFNFEAITVPRKSTRVIQSKSQQNGNDIQKLVFGQFYHVQFNPQKNDFIHFALLFISY